MPAGAPAARSRGVGASRRTKGFSTDHDPTKICCGRSSFQRVRQLRFYDFWTGSISMCKLRRELRELHRNEPPLVASHPIKRRSPPPSPGRQEEFFVTSSTKTLPVLCHLTGPCDEMRIIGVLEIMEHDKEKKQRNDPDYGCSDQLPSEGLRDVRQLSKAVRVELEKFFVATAELQSKTLECLGWRGPKHASQIIKTSARAFQGAR